jgi:hypothetical protein
VRDQQRSTQIGAWERFRPARNSIQHDNESIGGVISGCPGRGERKLVAAV